MHWWLRNDAWSLMKHIRGALLFFKVIHRISRPHGTKKWADFDPNWVFPVCNSSLNKMNPGYFSRVANALKLHQIPNFYASAFRRRRHYVFGVVRPSEAWNTRFLPVHGSVGPSIRLERFPGICRRTHGGNGLKFHMLMHLDHLQNWLVYGRGLLIFLILALFWLSETGQIWGFRVFPRECIEEMAWNFAHWCIMTTWRSE